MNISIDDRLICLHAERGVTSPTARAALREIEPWAGRAFGGAPETSPSHYNKARFLDFTAFRSK